MLRALFNHCACPKPCCSRLARRIQRCLWHRGCRGCRSDCAPLQAGIPSRAGGKWSCVMPRGPRAVTHTQHSAKCVTKARAFPCSPLGSAGQVPSLLVYCLCSRGESLCSELWQTALPPLLFLFISSDNCCRPGGPVLSPSHPPVDA